MISGLAIGCADKTKEPVKTNPVTPQSTPTTKVPGSGSTTGPGVAVPDPAPATLPRLAEPNIDDVDKKTDADKPSDKPAEAKPADKPEKTTVEEK